MKRILSLLLLLAAPGAFAELVTLANSTPQTALVQDVLPNPVRFLVTQGGVPVEGAYVTFQTGPGPGLSYGALGSIDYSECGGGDLVLVCSAVTGPDGIAQFVTLTSNFAKRFDVVASAWKYQVGDLGTTTLSFTFKPREGAMLLDILSGADQQSVMGVQAAAPLRIRLRKADGTPVANAFVDFLPKSYENDFLGFDGHAGGIYTDAEGVATSPPIFAGWILGAQTLQARTFDGGRGALITASATLKVTNGHGQLDLDLTNMWWGGSMENGWGMSVVKHGSQLFNVLFIYDSEGKPTWLVQPGGTWTRGLGSDFYGAIYSPRSAPWHAYDASKLVAGESVGRFITQFFGPERSQLVVDVPKQHQFIVKRMERQDFTGDAPSPMQGVADMWWGGPSQNGWGIAVLEQFGNLFLVWFTYGDDGKPTWFVMPGGTWSGTNAYSGSIYKTAGTDWVVGPYDASKLKASTVGNYTITFTPDGRAAFGYVLEGRSGTLALERQPFD